MPTVLKTDPELLSFRDGERSLLADLGLDLVERHCGTEEALIEHGQGADALMVIAAGLTTCSVEGASRAGVQVTFVPGASVEEVSDHTIAMLFALARHLPALDA